ncbi:MAG TPA: hypothetical protein VM513_13995 [Kofleriaceae bacterium]|nr:hypothetical protein [Kofleriaceae bacterium]
MKSVLVILSLSACATTTMAVDRESTPRTGVNLQLSLPHAASRVFPSAIDPVLPGADRLAHQIRARFGDVVATDLDLCVSPHGDVASASLPVSTGFDALDAALVRDASAWTFEAMPGPDGVKSCARARLVYRTPR